MIPGAMIALTAAPAGLDRVEHREERAHRLGHRHEPDDQLGDDRARALAADHRAEQVEPGRVAPGPPAVTTVPSESTNVSPSTCACVSPYFRQCGPPALVEAFPPSVEAIWLEGSGA
jgi:hypothetical protein